jgi:UDP-glucose 4-epimerase
VRVLDNFSTGRLENLDPRCEVVTGDVADADLVTRVLKGAAGCFHLAAISSVARANESWIETHRTNLTGTITVLDTARADGGVPVVYASSAAVYGDRGSDPIAEHVQPAPLTAYGADKLGSELHARVAFGVHGVPTLGLRMFNVYGPRQDPGSPYSGVISIFGRAIAQRAPVTVHADGMQVRDFVFVSDAVDHFVSGMAWLRENPSAAILNVCTGHGTRIRELAAVLGEIEQTVPDIRGGPARAGDIRSSVGDPTLAARLLGVRARLDLRRGLVATLASLGSGPKPAARGEIAGVAC